MFNMNKNLHAVSLGSLGGKARAKKLSPERRREIAINAVKAREEKRKIESKKFKEPMADDDWAFTQ